MANLSDTAQMTMDLYYQQFETDEDFFKLRHFLYLCGVAYSKLLEDEYKEARLEAKKDEGFTDIMVQDDWLVEETVSLQKDKDEEGVYTGVLKTPLFKFPYDPYSFGIQAIRKSGKTKCSNFIRTSAREAWIDCQLPVMDNRIYYYTVKSKIILTGAVRCPLDEIQLSSVPEISSLAFGKDGGPVPQSKEDTIIRKTLDLMIRARDGVVVDMSNNSNPNKTMQTEVDNVYGNLKTKPI